MEVLEGAKLLKANILGINLQRNADGATDGQIVFGDVDKSKFVADISYTSTVTDVDRWEIPLDDASVDGKVLSFKGKSAIIDTGTSFILLPPADAAQLHSLIPGSQPSGVNFNMPCSSTAVVQFIFSGVTYAVSPKDYVGTPDSTGQTCVSNIIGHAAFGPDEWLLGDVFLKNVYTVFDFDQDRIGFAEQGTSAPPSTEAASPSSGGASPTDSSEASGTSGASVTALPAETTATALPINSTGAAASLFARPWLTTAVLVGFSSLIGVLM
jgi:cathepsin D